MKRILFVDDDIPVLDALRLRLHRMHHKWSMTFADSADLAISKFQHQPYDVIVSDVCMPGMQGGRLLRTVSERWPETVRIALSGLSDPAQAVRLAPVAHQFLSKPCEPHLLEHVIERCLALQDLLGQTSLRAVVGRLRRLPSLRGTYSKLQSLLTRENATSHDVAAVIASDTLVAAKVLQMVNSAFFRRGRRISSIEQAVTYLGITAIRSLVLSAEVFSQWSISDAPIDLERLQQHSRQVAAVAHALARGTDFADDALLAALLHDVGYWVLAHECPVDLQLAHERAITSGRLLHETEKEVVGASHAEIGAYLLGIWGLPYPVVEAVAHHHEPHRVAQERLDVLGTLAIAQALTPQNDTACFTGHAPGDVRVDAAYLARLNAPFSWEEAERLASGALEQVGEIHS